MTDRTASDERPAAGAGAGGPRAPVIVVGVDGSEASEEAVVWALREAALRGARVVAVRVWSMPWSPEFESNWRAQRAEMMDDARAEVEDLISRARARAEVPSAPTVEVRVHDDERPAFVLTTAAEGADLLVVGSRGRGGLRGLLLGSVSTACVHHAPCPVVVVRGEAGVDADGPSPLPGGGAPGER